MPVPVDIKSGPLDTDPLSVPTASEEVDDVFGSNEPSSRTLHSTADSKAINPEARSIAHASALLQPESTSVEGEEVERIISSLPQDLRSYVMISAAPFDSLDRSVAWLLSQARKRVALGDGEPNEDENARLEKQIRIAADDSEGNHRRLSLLVPHHLLAASVAKAVGGVGESTAAHLADRSLEGDDDYFGNALASDANMRRHLSAARMLHCDPLRRDRDRQLLSDFSPLWQNLVHGLGIELRRGSIELEVNGERCRSASHAFDLVIESLTREMTNSEAAYARASSIVKWASSSVRAASVSLSPSTSPGTSISESPIRGSKQRHLTSYAMAQRATPETLTKLARLAILLCHPAAFMLPFEAVTTFLGDSEGSPALVPQGEARRLVPMPQGRVQRCELLCGSNPRRLLVRSHRPVMLLHDSATASSATAPCVIANVSFDAHLIAAAVEESIEHANGRLPLSGDSLNDLTEATGTTAGVPPLELEENATVEWDVSVLPPVTGP